MAKKEREPLKHKIKKALRLGRAIRLVWQCAPALTVAGYLLTFVQGILPLISLYLTKLVVDAVAAGFSAEDKGAAFQRAAVYIAGMAAVAVAGILMNSVAGLVGEAQSQIVTDHVSDVLHAKSVEMDLEYYENPKYYDTLHRAQQEAHFRPTRIVNGLAALGQSAVSLFAMAGLLFVFHWFVAVVVFLAAAPGIFVRLRYSGVMYEWQRRRTESERKAWYFHWILTDGGHAKEVRLFDLGPVVRGWFRDLRRKLRKEKIRLSISRASADLGAQVVASLMVFGTYGFIALKTVQGAITLGDLVMYFQAFQRGLSALQGLLGGLAGLYEDNLFLTNYTEFMDMAPRVRNPLIPKPLPAPMREGLAFHGVSFGYPSADRAVLEGVDLKIRPGEVVALVGANGAGKTTLIKLLCRLYDPTAGSVTIDGVDLRELDVAALRRQISVIFQDFVCYNLTARENVWMGNLGIPPTDPLVEAAAQESGAAHFIEKLPKGYDTVLGRWFEDAKELSIGEWQKVALARAFLRDSQVVVLDEPTSSMDAMAEYEVFAKFRQLMHGRSAVIISHRFSTVKMADTIYVLEGGRILESGSHDELMARGGTYAHLYSTQAQYYK